MRKAFRNRPVQQVGIHPELHTQRIKTGRESTRPRLFVPRHVQVDNADHATSGSFASSRCDKPIGDFWGDGVQPA